MEKNKLQLRWIKVQSHSTEKPFLGHSNKIWVKTSTPCNKMLYNFFKPRIQLNPQFFFCDKNQSDHCRKSLKQKQNGIVTRLKHVETKG